ncbi:hypothetical protein HELRODRAFT_163761 [Helobdella robusta]|uniref:VWFC domain-containing protein n=1 Tax=Helobdella robusta TaxID=6412 RepID=T1EUF7_HELRO|nr:hypothetical protein HELRODRAFT_163761 [Helobdella robusta]ESN96667.1 hypothetical protein HELRODRAFT_163761 [Helobdella robusta]
MSFILKLKLSLEFYDENSIFAVHQADPCIVDGKTYQDGEKFQPNCSLACSCQNGQYACATLCPQEERVPSLEHCRGAQLVAVQGRCCREWVCPHVKNFEVSAYFGLFN